MKIKENKFRDLGLEESKKIMIYLLDVLVDFCDFYRLKYSLSAGTLLGAIRHKGFIPWDDDIDVMMPRDDYNFLLKHFKKWAKNKDAALVTPNNRGYYMLFSKLYHKKTFLVQSGRVEKIGVWIDVFPVDYVLRQPLDSYKKMALISNELYYLGYKDFLIDLKAKKGTKFIFSLLSNFRKRIIRVIKKKRLLNAHSSFIKKHKGQKSMCFYFPKVIEIWSKVSNVTFDNLVYTEFENKKYKIISNWDEYLRVHYGNYMILPPIKERVIHQCEIRKILK